MMAARDDSSWAGAMTDLFHERIEQSPAWPDEQLVKDWEEGRARGYEHRGVFLDQAPLAAWQAAIDAGFKPDPNDNHESTANVWYAEGAPRFSHLIDPAHNCRLGVGDELVDYLKQGIGYDSEGEYVRMCVANGPSFVCEVDGEKVCWSCTHMSGTMGMIYTPPELRRKGYARSLAAFQIDYMLARDGVAICHVISTNAASREMLLGFGFTMIETPLVWRAVVWGE
jgi:ribosomal protein S18 acetylase RimI-like enzyme